MTNNKTQELNSFCRMVETLENGQLHSDLTDALKTIVEDMNNHLLAYHSRSTASLKLELKFLHERDETVTIEAKIDTKLPVPPRCKTLTWVGSNKNLQRTDPRQENLFNIKVIEEDTKNVKVL